MALLGGSWRSYESRREFTTKAQRTQRNAVIKKKNKNLLCDLCVLCVFAVHPGFLRLLLLLQVGDDQLILRREVAVQAHLRHARAGDDRVDPEHAEDRIVPRAAAQVVVPFAGADVVGFFF